MPHQKSQKNKTIDYDDSVVKSLYDELINFFNISDENYLDMTISAFEIIKEFKFENISNYHSKFLLK